MTWFGYGGPPPEQPTDLGPGVCPRCGGGDRCGCRPEGRLPDGDLPGPGETMRCHSCGEATDTLTLSWLECTACAAKR